MEEEADTLKTETSMLKRDLEEVFIIMFILKIRVLDTVLETKVLVRNICQKERFGASECSKDQLGSL